jgi:5-methylcytosine-specific restriction protein B
VTTDEGNNPRDISVSEAVGIARKHREQLLRGIDHLRQLPPNGDDVAYMRLQEHLDRDAPDVSNLAWGHKYFSLVFPDKLDDYHNPDYQRFHLVKLLQLPPAGDGRYVCAGRYVAAAAELGMPINHLTTILNHHNPAPHRYWRIGTSDGEQPRNRWPLMRDGSCAAIGWSDVGSLCGYAKDSHSRKRLINLLGNRYPGAPQQVGRAATQVLNFVSGIGEGDVVLACDGWTVLGIGRAVGDYRFEPGSDFPHRRPVAKRP